MEQRFEVRDVIDTSRLHLKVRNEDSALDDFIHDRTRILKTKLEVLAYEIHLRFQIRTTNMERISSDKEHGQQLLEQIIHQINYLGRERGDTTPLIQQIFDLETERRTQDVECWRDVVLVMRDFLVAWEAHEQAKSKAIFLDNV